METTKTPRTDELQADILSARYGKPLVAALDLCLMLEAELSALRQASVVPVYVIFDGPPGHEAGRFVEVETAAGKSISVGQWEPYGDTIYWRLGPLYASAAPPTSEAAWIPVGEGLPQEGEEIVWVSAANIPHAGRYRNDTLGGRGPTFKAIGVEMCASAVKCWQPLPSAPPAADGQAEAEGKT